MRLTNKLLDGMASALSLALSGNFQISDFTDEKIEDYERAAEWVSQEKRKRADRSIARQAAATEGDHG